MMQIVKEKLEIDEALEKKINNLLRFNNIKAKLEQGNIISLTNTNIAYIEPHTLEIKGICRVTIDVAPWEYTKSDRYLKMLINPNTFKKGSNRYD